MAIKSYSDSYLPYVAKNLGTMFEHAVDNGKNPIIFWNIFVNSFVAKQIEKGNPKYLSCSALDYLAEILNEKINQNQNIEMDKYYWAGWALAQLQHKTEYSFYKINNLLPIEQVLNLYHTLHEADITKFFDVADDYFSKAKVITNLKKVRQAAGLSQTELARLAEVDLRSIQMYEQRRNDINKAQAETLYKLAKVLGCNIEDLLEN
jgi:DNA-binding XRE family transcriptional regulator